MVALARARAREFEARVRARSQLGLRDEWGLAAQVLWDFGQGLAHQQIALRARQRRQELRARQEALTDFRLYWDRVGGALTGRPKVLIDSDKVPGRRHLWLVPVELPPLPGAMVPARDRDGRERKDQTSNREP
jgi:hypothetical protein